MLSEALSVSNGALVFATIADKATGIGQYRSLLLHYTHWRLHCLTSTWRQGCIRTVLCVHTRCVHTISGPVHAFMTNVYKSSR